MNAGEQETPPTVRRVHHQCGHIRERYVSEIFWLTLRVRLAKLNTAQLRLGRSVV